MVFVSNGNFVFGCEMREIDSWKMSKSNEGVWKMQEAS